MFGRGRPQAPMPMHTRGLIALHPVLLVVARYRPGGVDYCLGAQCPVTLLQGQPAAFSQTPRCLSCSTCFRESSSTWRAATPRRRCQARTWDNMCFRDFPFPRAGCHSHVCAQRHTYRYIPHYTHGPVLCLISLLSSRNSVSIIMSISQYMAAVRSWLAMSKYRLQRPAAV